jgi:hypothetical protein
LNREYTQERKKKPFGVPPAFLYGSFLPLLSCPAIAFGDGGTPSSFSKPFKIIFHSIISTENKGI